jgi:hypothetical protein
MSNKHCGPDIIKYFVVEPSTGGSLTGSTSDFFVCSGTTFLKTISGCTDNVNLNDTIFYNSGEVFFNGIITACTGVHTSNIYGCSPITIHNDLLPVTDGDLDLGSTTKRFRDVNTISGTSTVWTVTNKIITPEIDLGLDSLGNNRVINANNSVIQNDILNGGIF